MKMNRSYILAAAIAFVIGAWILSGQFGGADGVDDETAALRGAVETEQPDTGPLARVRARVFAAEPRITTIDIRGRTEAVRKVEVRAETSGTVVALPLEKGSRVETGDVLCELSLNARDAKLAEAEALTRQRWLEFDAAKKLAAKGHRSETQAAASRAAYDAAKAQLKQIEVELGQTKIVAPFDGVLDERHVEIGDYLAVAAPCATIVDLDPFLVVGQISERDVGKLTVGAPGTAALITGETVDGHIRFIAKTADEATRTFRVELEVPNEGQQLRDGLTAEIRVPSESVPAHRIPTSVLSLNDDGVIGVRILDENDVVRFLKVELVEDSESGVWVSGLPQTVTLITVGQDFVKPGQKVNVTLDKTEGAAT